MKGKNDKRWLRRDLFELFRRLIMLAARKLLQFFFGE